jgi:large subunit ribosomal protein L4
LVSALEKVGAAADRKVLLILDNWDESVVRAGRNVEKLSINTADRLQVFDVLNADVLVFEKAAIAKVKELYAPSAPAASDA